MILLSSRKLEQALVSGKLAPWDKVKYIILPVVITSLFPVFYIYRPIYGMRPPALNTLVGLVCMIINAVVCYKGIKKCFKTNQESDGRHFFERFAILSLPVFMKFILILLPLSLALTFYMHSLRDVAPDFHKRSPLIFTISSPLWTWVYYCLLTASFKRLGDLLAPRPQVEK